MGTSGSPSAGTSGSPSVDSSFCIANQPDDLNAWSGDAEGLSAIVLSTYGDLFGNPFGACLLQSGLIT